MKKQISIKTKLSLSIAMLAIIIAGVISSFWFIQTKQYLQDDIKIRLLDIVSIASLQIDTEKHSELKIIEDEKTEDFQSIKKGLQDIRDNATDIYYIYTMRENQEGEILFVVDAEENPDEIAHLGEEYYDASTFLKNNFLTLNEPYVEKEFYTDRWGTWLTGYAPFYDEDGNREGVIGIDIEATQVIAQEKRALYVSLLFFAISGLFAILLGIFLGNNLTKPIISLTNELKKFTKEKNIHATPTDNNEITVLAKTFKSIIKENKALQNNLEEKIEERTKHLKKLNKTMIGRELEMIKMKEKNKKVEGDK